MAKLPLPTDCVLATRHAPGASPDGTTGIVQANPTVLRDSPVAIPDVFDATVNGRIQGMTNKKEVKDERIEGGILHVYRAKLVFSQGRWRRKFTQSQHDARNRSNSFGYTTHWFG
jgi:hypothetical protein